MSQGACFKQPRVNSNVSVACYNRLCETTDTLTHWSTPTWVEVSHLGPYSQRFLFLENCSFVFLRKVLRIRIFLFTMILILRITLILRIFLRMVFILRIFLRIRINCSQKFLCLEYFSKKSFPIHKNSYSKNFSKNGFYS